MLHGAGVGGRSSFDAEAADVATVAQICRRLDGLPLAIELAAARLRALSLEQVATRLDDRFRLLGAGERTLYGSSSQAWSYDLLTDTEREVFVRLAVFPADFSLEATEMVVSDAVVEESDVLDLLTRLVEKSLVTTVMSGDTCRYRLLETLRVYGLARLDERGEIDRWNDRLLDWVMTRCRVRGGVAAPTGTRRGAGISPRRSRHIAGGDGLGEPPRRPARRVADRHGGTHRPRRRTPPDHWRTARATRIPESNRGSWRTPTHGAREPRVRAGRLGGIIRNPTRPPPSSSCSRGPHGDAACRATYLGVYGAWGTGDLIKADALLRQAIDGFRSDGDTMGLGYALSDAATLTTDLDEAQRLVTEADELLRASGAPRPSPTRSMVRDHRLRPRRVR